MNQPSVQDLIEVLEEAVMCEPGDIRPEMELSAVGGFDSSSAVYFMGEVAGRWGRNLSTEALRSCVTVADLCATARGER